MPSLWLVKVINFKRVNMVPVPAIAPARAAFEIVIASGRGSNCIASERRSQCGGGKSNATMFEEIVKLFQGAGHPFLSGVFIGPQGLADRAKVQPLIKAQHNGGTVRRAKLVDRFVENGRNLAQVCFRVIL